MKPFESSVSAQNCQRQHSVIMFIEEWLAAYLISVCIRITSCQQMKLITKIFWIFIVRHSDKTKARADCSQTYKVLSVRSSNVRKISSTKNAIYFTACNFNENVFKAKSSKRRLLAEKSNAWNNWIVLPVKLTYCNMHPCHQGIIAEIGTKSELK